MENFLLLTTLGVIIGIYSVLPEYKKLRMTYSFGRFEKYVVGTIAFVMLLLFAANSFLINYNYNNSTLNLSYNFNDSINLFSIGTT